LSDIQIYNIMVCLKSSPMCQSAEKVVSEPIVV
jgi:hypothetical protein